MCSTFKLDEVGHFLSSTRVVLRLVWPSIPLESARNRAATAALTVTASRLWSAIYIYISVIMQPTIIYDYNWEAHVRLLHLLYNKDGLYICMKRLKNINNKILIKKLCKLV